MSKQMAIQAHQGSPRVGFLRSDIVEGACRCDNQLSGRLNVPQNRFMIFDTVYNTITVVQNAVQACRIN